MASGATVIATSSSNDKLTEAKKLGAKYLINYKEKPDWDQEVLKIVRIDLNTRSWSRVILSDSADEW